MYSPQNGHSPGLPKYSASSAVQEKERLQRKKPTSWKVVSLPIPGVKNRRLRCVLPPILARGKGLLLVVLIVASLFTLFALGKRFGSAEKAWPNMPAIIVGDAPTLIYQRDDLARVWLFEIASGRYPSRAPIPAVIGLDAAPLNPALPVNSSQPARVPLNTLVTWTIGTGAERTYPDIQSLPPNIAYPPRPPAGSIADLDRVMEHCNFDKRKYVRDCLEVLSTAAGLDNGKRLRRGSIEPWKYIYTEGPMDTSKPEAIRQPRVLPLLLDASVDPKNPNGGLSKRRDGIPWEPSMKLPMPATYTPYVSRKEHCDPENPRIFHMFWAGAFTDKPYMALLAFLYTQNLGLDLDKGVEPDVCRPVFWLWINPGPAASVPNPNAVRDMFDELKANPWASPFLHPRFHEVIKVKLWNTTEQLDATPELKDEWRGHSLFRTGGTVLKADLPKDAPAPAQSGNSTVKPKQEELVGTKDSSSYDRLSVVLSDLARFLLTHRYGGIYLDADTILLRDWEELWGWRGSFAYRWSRMEKYNTAVLRMQKGSALGSFLLRTALRNGMDVHPMIVSLYTKDAHLENLLLRLPDALFDSAWLNTEPHLTDFHNRDRPPQPYLSGFEDFFDTPTEHRGSPASLGFDGFFKGAYSNHYHNFWWKPFDPSRDFPDLGPRFAVGEKALRKAKPSAGAVEGEDSILDDTRDLSWSTVIKRTFEGYIRGEIPSMYGEWINFL